VRKLWLTKYSVNYVAGESFNKAIISRRSGRALAGAIGAPLRLNALSTKHGADVVDLGVGQLRENW
jgi:hypothetical protein